MRSVFSGGEKSGTRSRMAATRFLRSRDVRRYWSPADRSILTSPNISTDSDAAGPIGLVSQSFHPISPLLERCSLLSQASRETTLADLEDAEVDEEVVPELAPGPGFDHLRE